MQVWSALAGQMDLDLLLKCHFVTFFALKGAIVR
jgi:hypothetical protein